MVDAIAVTGAGIVLMHMQGTPQYNATGPAYDDVVEEVADFLGTNPFRDGAQGIVRRQDHS